MSFPGLYSDPAENLIFWGAITAFAAFLLLVLAAKLASGKDCQARLNKTHFYFFLPYALTVAVFLVSDGHFSLNRLTALTAGAFIYFSLHYIYLQGLVGLAKKSVSVNILGSIAAAGTGQVTEDSLLAQEEEKIRLIREDRLQQMLILGMAVKNDSIYRLTTRGRFLNSLGCAILKVWNLRRP